MLGSILVSCSKDDVVEVENDNDDYKYVGQAVGNMSADEWYPGGKLGTTENTGSTCYQDQTPAVDASNIGFNNSVKRQFLQDLVQHTCVLNASIATLVMVMENE